MPAGGGAGGSPTAMRCDVAMAVPLTVAESVSGLPAADAVKVAWYDESGALYEAAESVPVAVPPESLSTTLSELPSLVPAASRGTTVTAITPRGVTESGFT